MKKLLKNFCCGIVSLSCLCFAVISFSACSSPKVVKIYSVEDFLQYAGSCESKQEDGLVNQVSFGSIKLMADLDFSEVEYHPIHLKMDFDGNGYSLNNITINEYEETNGIGVFSINQYKEEVQNTATIKNLTINNLTINYTGSKTPVGGLLGAYSGSGYFYEGGGLFSIGDMVYQEIAIENVKINGKINAPQTNCVGGLIGKACKGYVKNCEVDVEINGGSKTGGIIGGLNGESERVSPTNIEGCVNKGAIVGKVSVGGIVGEHMNVLDCTNTGDVTGEINVGGIIGYTQYSIANCVNEGKVEGTAYGENEYADIGGIAGYAKCYTWDTYKGKQSNGAMITDCTNKGTVLSAYDRIGGIAGYSSQEISGCSNEATVQGRDVVGGIIGWWASTGSVSKCKNSGDVTGAVDVGGLVGGISVTDTVKFMNSHNSGKITGNNRVGGFVGGSFATLDADLLPTCSNTGDLVCDGIKNDSYNKVG